MSASTSVTGGERPTRDAPTTHSSAAASPYSSPHRLAEAGVPRARQAVARRRVAERVVVEKGERVAHSRSWGNVDVRADLGVPPRPVQHGRGRVRRYRVCLGRPRGKVCTEQACRRGVCVGWVAVAKARRVRRVLGGLFSMGQGQYVNVGHPLWSCGGVMIGRGGGERRRKPPCAEYVVPRIGLRMAESGGHSPRPPASGYALGLGADRLGRRTEGKGGGGERGEWSRGHAATASGRTA